MSGERGGADQNDEGRSISTQTAETLSLADAISRAEAAERRVRELEAALERQRLPAPLSDMSPEESGWLGRAELLDTIFEAVPDRISLFDRHGRLIRMNSSAQRNSGSNRGGEGPDKFQSAYTLRRLDGEPFPTEELPTMRSLRGETVTNVEMLFRAADGSDQVIVTNSAPIRDHAGDMLGVVSITHDVTEQRRLAARTRESLDALLHMARLLVQPAPDDAGDGEDAPPAANLLAHRLATLTCSVLGCTRVSLSVVEPETQLVKPLTVVGMSPEDTRAWIQEQTDHATRLGEGADPDLMRRFNAGEVLVIDMTQPPYNALPNPYNITTVLTVALRVGEQVVGLLALDHSGAEHHYTADEVQLAQAIAQLTALVVERDRLLQERATAEAQVLALEETNRRMSEFLSIASHELRTPLTSAIANTQLAEKQMRRLREDDTEEGTAVRRLRWLVTRTEQQLRRQSRLVADLLDVSRIEAGMLVMDLQPCDIVAIAREAVEEQRLAHPGRAVKLSAPPAHTPIEAVMDADRIGQVVTNFLTNALKYSPPDAPLHVRVTAHAGRARVTVHDHGPGLPAEEREAIWEQFHRVPGVEVLSGSGVGLGIGLYISRTIIERHGGVVGVRSAPGEGSTFWFEVPCVAAPLPDSADQ
ncbi:MAG TPA: ATP-binding protein [Ktedonobacterales bacterium]|nr:ATP-binding protein [Ktedonobacterales bacterium]